MLCYFQVYGKVSLLYTNIHLFFFKVFSHVGCQIILSRVPHVKQQVLYWLSILNITACTCQSQTPNLFLPTILPLANHKFVL